MLNVYHKTTATHFNGNSKSGAVAQQMLFQCWHVAMCKCLLHD